MLLRDFRLKTFIYATALLNFAVWIAIVENQFNIPAVAKYLISLFFVISLFMYYLIYRQKIYDSALIKISITIFIIYTYALIIGSFRPEIFYLQEIFASRYYFMPYFFPTFILFSSFGITFFRYLLKITIMFQFPAIITQLVILVTSLNIENWYELFNRIWIFELAAPLLLLTHHVFNKRRIGFIVQAYFLITLFMSAYFGRRGLFLDALMLLTAMVFLRISAKSVAAVRKYRLLFVILLLSIVTLFSLDFVWQKLYIFERGFDVESLEKSRGKVFKDYFYDFNSTEDYAVGRGLNGTVLRTISKDSDRERSIENGFLTILLKGGLLYVIPYLIILFRSFYLGYFRSNNDLSKALAFIILIQILGMVSFNLPDYSTRYVLVWIAVSAGFNRNLRETPNFKIIKLLNV
jgi:hypothetical protein